MPFLLTNLNGTPWPYIMEFFIANFYEMCAYATRSSTGTRFGITLLVGVIMWKILLIVCWTAGLLSKYNENMRTRSTNPCKHYWQLSGFDVQPKHHRHRHWRWFRLAYNIYAWRSACWPANQGAELCGLSSDGCSTGSFDFEDKEVDFGFIKEVSCRRCTLCENLYSFVSTSFRRKERICFLRIFYIL